MQRPEIIIDWINDDWSNVVVSDAHGERVLAEVDFDTYGGHGMASVIAVVSEVAAVAGLAVSTRGTIGRDLR